MQLQDVKIVDNPIFKIPSNKIPLHVFILRNQIPIIEVIDIVTYLYKRGESILFFVAYDDNKDIFDIAEQKEMWKSVGVIFDNTSTLFNSFEYQKPYIENIKEIISNLKAIVNTNEMPIFWIRKEQENLFKNYITKVCKEQNMEILYGVVENIDGEEIRSVSTVLEKFFLSDSFYSKDSLENDTDIEVCKVIDTIFEKFKNTQQKK